VGVYKSSALATSTSNPFIGFVTATTSAGSQVPILIAGETTGITGLTPGSFYYLSDTAGAISTTAGTVTRKCGIATSASTLLLTNIW
jgi:hypothetical protein